MLTYYSERTAFEWSFLSFVSHVLPLVNVLALFVTSNNNYVGVKNPFRNYLSTVLWRACRYTGINCACYMRGSMRVVMLPIFLSETIITMVMKFTGSMGTSCTKLRLFFHHVSFFCMCVCDSVCWSSKTFLKHIEFQLIIICKTIYSECIFQGSEKVEVGGG
jgi:hypothetical protein